MKLDCKHVWEHISEYIDNRFHAEHSGLDGG